MSKPHPLIGRTLHLSEADYRYGVGTLEIRVIALLRVQTVDDGPWVDLRGIEMWDDKEFDEREVSVRVSALPEGVRHGLI